jgi:hypothetical protein
MQNADAGLAVGDERGAVAIVNPAKKEVQIAAEIEDTGRSRTQDEILQCFRPLGELSRDAALPSVEVVEKVEIVARPSARPHEGPQRTRRVIPQYLKLIELEQPPRVEADRLFNRR